MRAAVARAAQEAGKKAAGVAVDSRVVVAVNAVVARVDQGAGSKEGAGSRVEAAVVEEATAKNRVGIHSEMQSDGPGDLSRDLRHDSVPGPGRATAEPTVTLEHRFSLGSGARWGQGHGPDRQVGARRRFAHLAALVVHPTLLAQAFESSNDVSELLVSLRRPLQHLFYLVWAAKPRL